MSGQPSEQAPIVRVAFIVIFVNLAGTAILAVILSAYLFVRSVNADAVVSKETFWTLFVVGTFNTFGAVYMRHLAKARAAAVSS
jgi:hypothetical protein